MKDQSEIILIGTTANADPIYLDLAKLVSTRMLIEADSGGGKSCMLRLIAESAGRNEHLIIIDPEGEFSTLREQLDLLWVGGGGEVPATVRSAGVLAKTLVERRISAVIDLFELDPAQQHEYARNFFDGLMSVRDKSMWHRVLLLVDEAQEFAPEAGRGESTSSPAFVRVMKQGRKRGIATIPATQRISSLSKDVANLCRTVLVGPTAPKDCKIAAELLGIESSLAKLLTGFDPGTWIGRGPAIGTREAIQFMARPVVTTHPDTSRGAGSGVPIPAASSAIKAILADLKELTDDDSDEPHNLAEAQETIAQLRKDLETAKGQPSFSIDPVERERIAANAKDEAMHAIGPIIKQFTESASAVDSRIANAAECVKSLHSCIASFNSMLDSIPTSPARVASPVKNVPVNIPAHNREVAASYGVTKTQQRVLDALAWWESLGVMSVPTARVGVIAKIDTSGGYFSKVVGPISTNGLVNRSGGEMSLTDLGRAIANKTPIQTNLSAYHEMLLLRFEGRTRDILMAVMRHGGRSLSSEQIGASVGVDHTGGYFSKIIGPLGSMGLIDRSGGTVRPTSLLFPEGLR